MRYFVPEKTKDNENKSAMVGVNDLQVEWEKEKKISEELFNNSIWAKKDNYSTEGNFYFRTIDEENGLGFKRPFDDTITNVIQNMQNRNNHVIYFTPKEKEIMSQKPLSFCGLYPIEDAEFEIYYKNKFGIDENDMLFQLIVDYKDGSDANVCMVNWSKKYAMERWGAFRSHYLGGYYYIYA